MNRRFRVSVFLTLSMVLCSGALRAYEVAPVENGGTVTGKVKRKGKAAASAKLEVERDQTTCGTEIVDESVVTKQGMIQNAVVSIEGITAGKEPAGETPSLGNQGCRFVPHVQTVQVGASLIIDSTDPILHSTHGFHESGRTAFNVALPYQDKKVKQRIRRPGVISLKCDAGHSWMSGYVLAFEHPYHAVTGEDGSFTISDVPPGSYTLTLWHETFPSRTAEITVEAGKATSVDFELGNDE